MAWEIMAKVAFGFQALALYIFFILVCAPNVFAGTSVSVIQGIVDGISYLKMLTCPLLASGPSPHGLEGLSKYWAQEYVGADLARKRLQAQEVSYAHQATSRGGQSLEIWDGLAFHGVRVSNLIAGPFPSALVPAQAPVGHTNMVTFFAKYSFNVYVDNYASAAGQIHQHQNYAFYLNNSMEWNSSPRLREIFQDLASAGVVIVTSAANPENKKDVVKQQLAQQKKIILVASLDPWGCPSTPDIGQEVPLVYAGGHQHLTSFGTGGEEQLFGGSSGATAQVTAALLAFTLITGQHLSPDLAITLLAKTAIPILIGGNKWVAMLNSLRIVELGFLLQDICQASAACMREQITSEHLYQTDFNITRHAIHQAERAFPLCFSGVKTTANLFTTTAPCSQQQEAFNLLRTAALLDAQNSILWQLLACISNGNGLVANGEFYQRLAIRPGPQLASAIFLAPQIDRCQKAAD